MLLYARLMQLKETRLRCIKYEEALKQLEADKQKLEKDKTLLAAELSEEMNKMAGEKNVLVKQLREQVRNTVNGSLTKQSNQQVMHLLTSSPTYPRSGIGGDCKFSR